MSLFHKRCLFWVILWLASFVLLPGASQVTLLVKNLPANSGDISDMGLIPESGKYPGGGMTTHASILVWRIPRDRRAWRATVQRVSKSQTLWSDLACFTPWGLVRFSWFFVCLTLDCILDTLNIVLWDAGSCLKLLENARSFFFLLMWICGFFLADSQPD